MNFAWQLQRRLINMPLYRPCFSPWTWQDKQGCAMFDMHKNTTKHPPILQPYTPIRLSCQQLHTLKGLAFNRLLRFVVRWWNAERCVLPTQSLSLYIYLSPSLSPALFPSTVLNYHSKWDLVFFLSPFSTQFNQVMKWLSHFPGQMVLRPWHFRRHLLKCTSSCRFLL